MSTMQARTIASGLQSKGFKRSNRHHVFFHLYINGRRTPVHTRISHGQRECGDSLISMMSKDLRLKPKQFKRLVTCPMSFQVYVKHLANEGHITLE